MDLENELRILQEIDNIPTKPELIITWVDNDGYVTPCANAIEYLDKVGKTLTPLVGGRLLRNEYETVLRQYGLSDSGNERTINFNE
jgi:hypothetical protein